MENTSWSKEQILAVVNEFNDKMEELRKQAPKFQHIDFVKFALIFLTREGLTTNLQIEDVKDEMVGSILQYFKDVMADSNFKLKSNNKHITYTLKEAILEIYSNTIKVIPFEVFIENYLDSIFIPLGDFLKNRIEEFNAISSYNAYDLNDKSLYIKGYCAFSALLTKLEEPKSIWDNKIAIEFDDFDDLYIFDIIYGARISTIQDKIVFINQAPFDGNQKIDLYIDMTFDFVKTSSVLEQLTPKGEVVAGVNEHVIKGENQIVRELFDDRRVRTIHTNGVDNGWIEFGIEKNSVSPSFYSSDHDICREIETDEIIRYGYSLDFEKYDVFEKVDGFTTTIIDNLQNVVEGYEASTASLFLIPYFKKHYKGVLSTLIDDYTQPDFKALEDDCVKRHEGEKLQVVRAFNFCVSQIGSVYYYSDAKYQHFLNAIRMIDTIDDHIFHKYYSEIIERICEKVVLLSYTSQYHFIESQIGNTNDLQIVVRKDDYADIVYSGDSGIDELTSYAGWGSVITPKILNGKLVEVEMAFDIDADEFFYDPVCSASQYVIFDALRDKNKSQYVRNIATPICDVADIIIDLHKDVRQYEQLKSRLNPDGRYVTFAMKKDMEACQPVIEHLIKENLLEKVVSLNNRYLLFINQSKQDDKVVLAKFNHVDDERWLESYQDIIDELALNADSKHVRILSRETLAANNYSFSTDQYFVSDPNSDIKTNIHSIVSQLRNKYDTKDILLNIMLRVATLRNEGKSFSVANWDNVKKLNDVLSSMKESEEILMEHYTECLDFIMEIYGSDTSSKEFYQPEVAKLMADLIESDSVHKLYNPFAGLASFACLFPHSNYYGDEINESVFSFGSFHLDAKGLLESARYTCGNSFQFFKKTENEIFDTILTIPPFLPQKETSLYDFLFSECMDHLEENGKMTVVLPAGFTFNQSPKIVEIRKKIVENHWVEKVISLPGGTFRGTNVNTCIIQLSKCANTEIVFCDATQLVEKSKGKVFPKFDAILSAVKNNDKSYCFSIPYSSISENNNSLNPITYKPFPEQDGTTTYKLGELLTKVKRETISVSEGLVLGVDMLSSDVVEYRRDISDLRMEPVNDMMIPLHGEALLLSPIQGTLRPTYVEVPESTCYHVKRNLLAFKVESAKVFPAYICYALTQPEVSHQIDNYRAGMLINSEDLLNVWINLPDITTQKNIVGELTRQRYAEKKQELDKMYGTAYAEKEEEFKSLKHAMGKSVAGITAAVDNLYNYFAETGQLDTIVHKRRASTLGDKLNVIQQSVQHIAVLLKHGADFLDVSQYPMKSVTIDNLWNCIDYETDRFMLNKSALLDESIRQMTIRMNIDLFRILVNDILSNAEKHAFEDDDPSNTVCVEYDYDNTWFTLFISNNGQPFPDDVDVKKFTKRYWSAGNHQGSGIGGHDILKIMTAFQGEFELLTDYEDSYPTCYVLRFPVE